MRVESERVGMVMEWFGLKGTQGGCEVAGVEVPLVREGEIGLIVGASGAGKSGVLRKRREKGKDEGGRMKEERIRNASPDFSGSSFGVHPSSLVPVHWVELGRVRVPRGRAVVDCFRGGELKAVLMMLS